MKIYFSGIEDNFKPLSYWEWLMEQEQIESFDLYEAENIQIDGAFFCNCFELAGNKGICGKECYMYNPRNGKSGCCKHYTNNIFERTDKKITIKLKPKAKSNV